MRFVSSSIVSLVFYLYKFRYNVIIQEGNMGWDLPMNLAQGGMNPLSGMMAVVKE